MKHAAIDVSDRGAKIADAVESVPLASRDFDSLRSVVTDIVAQSLRRYPGVNSVGISTTGSVDREGVVVSAGHFTGYKDVSWWTLLNTNFDCLERVVTVNDGRASAWAEYSDQSADIASLIHAVVGTGVGGGIVYNGELLLGDSGQAGYIGHIKLTPLPTPVCSCGQTGCVEILAAAPAVVRYFDQTRGGDDTESSSFATVTEAAQGGDPAAIEAFSTAGRWLGIGLGNAMNVLNPSKVTVGGGVIVASAAIDPVTEGDPYFTAVGEGVAIAAHRRVFASATICTARFGNDGGLLGAAQLAARPIS